MSIESRGTRQHVWIKGVYTGFNLQRFNAFFWTVEYGVLSLTGLHRLETSNLLEQQFSCSLVVIFFNMYVFVPMNSPLMKSGSVRLHIFRSRRKKAPNLVTTRESRMFVNYPQRLCTHAQTMTFWSHCNSVYYEYPLITTLGGHHSWNWYLSIVTGWLINWVKRRTLFRDRYSHISSLTGKLFGVTILQTF